MPGVGVNAVKQSKISPYGYGFSPTAFPLRLFPYGSSPTAHSVHVPRSDGLQPEGPDSMYIVRRTMYAVLCCRDKVGEWVAIGLPASRVGSLTSSKS